MTAGELIKMETSKGSEIMESVYARCILVPRMVILLQHTAFFSPGFTYLPASIPRFVLISRLSDIRQKRFT